jgi:hypothetical protein
MSSASFHGSVLLMPIPRWESVATMMVKSVMWCLLGGIEPGRHYIRTIAFWLVIHAVLRVFNALQ